MIVCIEMLLGLSGAQEDLVGLGFNGFESQQQELLAISGRSSDGTLHTDFVGGKNTYQLGYKVVRENQKATLDGLFQTQLTNGFLTFTFSDSNGIRTDKLVQMSPPSYGPIQLLQDSNYYYQSVSFNLVEV